MTYIPASFITANQLATGGSTITREASPSGITLSSGIMRIRFFTAQQTESITQIRTYTGSTAAGATPTICRVGIYTVDGSGNLSLSQSTANDTAMWASANTAYEKTLDTTFSKVAGTRYAIGALCVTGAAAPTIAGGFIGSAPLGGRAPRLVAQVGSQTDLPATISVGSLSESTISTFFELLP